MLGQQDVKGERPRCKREEVPGWLKTESAGKVQDVDCVYVYAQMPRNVDMYAVMRANRALFVFFFFGC